MYSQSVPALISKNVGNALDNYNTWGGIVYNVKAYGAKGDGSTDDTTAIQSALTAVNATGGGVIFFPYTSSFYKITSSLSLNLADGVSIAIIGYGNPEIRMTVDPNVQYAYMVNLQASSATPLNVTVQVEGLRFNGVGVPEQWTETVYANLTTLYGLNIKASYVTVENCRFENIYGYGVNIKNYRKASVSNCHFEKVGGHWYTNDTYDAFGDAVYFGYAQDAYAVATCTNARLVGYPSDRPRLSRIGVTIEYAAGNVFVNKCYIEGYDRAIHCESATNAQIYIDGVDIERYNVGVFIHTGAKSLDVTNANFRNNNNGDYGGTSGPFGTSTISTVPDYARFTNCNFIIGFNVVSQMDCPTSFESCKFKNSGGIWQIQTVSQEITDMSNCLINGQALYFASSKVGQIKGCTAIGVTGSTEVMRFDGTSSFARKISNCRFVNAFINIANGPDFNFEFDSCRFEKDGTVVIKDNAGNTVTGFIQPYATTIIIRDCLEIVDVAFPFNVYNNERLIGANYKVVAGVWGTYP